MTEASQLLFQKRTNERKMNMQRGDEGSEINMDCLFVFKCNVCTTNENEIIRQKADIKTEVICLFVCLYKCR